MTKESLERAKKSLLGLWIGDAFGGHYELDHVDWNRPARAAEKRELPPSQWRYTDDTQMALSIYETLRRYQEIQSDELAQSFIDHFEISRGYGIGTEDLLTELQAGGDWSQLASARFGGKGSFGNGSAMRAAPIGAYFSDDLDAVVENARRSSITTHTHVDAVAGAIAVALASSQASQLTDPDADQYWPPILAFTPSSELRDRLQIAADLASDTPTKTAADALGCGWDVSAVDTVPFALWCAIRYIDDMEEALWQTISVGGDADTTGAIVGGVIAAKGVSGTLPKHWVERCEPLPAWPFDD